MATTVARLSSNGVYFTNTYFDEVTYTTNKISTTAMYSGGFDEVTIQGGSTAKRETSDGWVLVSGYFDEVTGIGIPIVTSGLVLSLDAGNNSSYPGSGNTWIDISGGGNNATLNNTTYTSTNGGYLNFSKSPASYASFFAPNLAGNWATVEMWVNLNSDYAGGMFMGWNFYDIWTNGGSIGYNTAASDVYGISSSTATSLGLVGNWKQYVFVMNNQNYTNNQIYINGSLQTLSQQYGGQNTGQLSFNSGNGVIGGWGSNPAQFPISMKLGIYRVYNTQFTQAQVIQNFNAQKSRFGI
jgi:hypothetical protein